MYEVIESVVDEKGEEDVLVIETDSLQKANQYVLEMMFNSSEHDRVMDQQDAFDTFIWGRFIIKKESLEVYDSDKEWWS